MTIPQSPKNKIIYWAQRGALRLHGLSIQQFLSQDPFSDVYIYLYIYIHHVYLFLDN